MTLEEAMVFAAAWLAKDADNMRQFGLSSASRLADVEEAAILLAAEAYRLNCGKPPADTSWVQTTNIKSNE